MTSWNLGDDSQAFGRFTVHQISIICDNLETNTEINDLRLLVLSHRIANRGSASFFLREPPCYSPASVDQSVVLVYDFENNFRNFGIDEHRFSVSSWLFDPENDMSNLFLDHIQRALTLLWLYRLKDQDPIYFTTFLLIPRSEMMSEPFIVQKIVMRLGNTLCIRTIVQGELRVAVNTTTTVPVGSYVLLPPYEHPFSVVTNSDGNLMLMYVDRSSLMITPSRRPYVYITSPNIAMGWYLRVHESSAVVPAENISVQVRNFMDFPQDEVTSFLESVFKECRSEHREILTSELDCDESTPLQVVQEQVQDVVERKLILSFVGDQEARFPSCIYPLSLFSASFLSFFRFDFGFPGGQPPYHCREFGTYVSCEHERLGIPRVLVNGHGNLIDVPADNVIGQWEERRFLPISGAKNAHFVVFCQNGIDPMAVRSFFKEFCHIYNMHGFGKLTPFSRSKAFFYEPAELLPSRINEFFQSEPLSEFQMSPILLFIVAHPIYDSTFIPRSIISYVRPRSIISANCDEIRTLAFVVYSRIRPFAPYPYGMLDLVPSQAGILMFGYRHQPPFMLRAEGGTVTFHVAWDPKKNATTYMDDVGGILHYAPFDERRHLSALNNIHVIIQQIATYYRREVKPVLTVLGEGVSSSDYDLIREEFGSDFSNLTLFAVSPAPVVQVVFREEYDDDVLIFAPVERMWEGHHITPLSSCYVASRHHPAYSCCLYEKDAVLDASNVLRHYVTSMSHLSWLSVKPGSEKRTVSLPPHVSALLRKNGPDTRVLSRFEFLPSREWI